MKVLLVGDIHLADRPPSIRTDTYAQDILAKLEQTVRIAQAEQVDVAVWAGDVWHVKAAARTSHWLVQRTADIGKAYPCDWAIVPGNHDMANDRLESLEKQPLGVLFRAGAVPLIGERQFAAGAIFGLPWLYDWTRDLPRWMKAWWESKAELMVTHAPIVQPGESRPFEVIDAEDWAEMMGRSGSVYAGHMHDPDGAYETAEGSWFCNQGALSRGSLHEATLRRKPAVTIWDSETVEPFMRVEIAHKPAAEVFRLAEKQTADEAQERAERFLTEVGQTTLEGLSVEAVLAHVQGLGLKEDTLENIRDVLEVALS